MTALAAPRHTDKREHQKLVKGVKAAKKIFQGGLTALEASSGYATPGATATGLRALGRANATVDNSAGANGAKSVEIEEGVFQWANSAGADEITDTEIGQVCYIVDDQTVAKTSASGTRSAAGFIRDVDSTGVWVETRNNVPTDGDLVAANNLSDVAAAATARANIGANKVSIGMRIANLVGADAKVYRAVAPVAGDIAKAYSVLEEAALAGGDATLTLSINGTPVTGGAITITQSGSAAGDVDSVTPSAAKTVAAGDVIECTVGGTNTDTDAYADVTLDIET